MGTTKVFAVFLDFPVWLCKSRVIRRPEHETLPPTAESLVVVDRFHGDLMPPIQEEGFLEVHHITDYASLEKIAGRLASMLPTAAHKLTAPKNILITLRGKAGGRKSSKDACMAVDPTAGHMPRFVQRALSQSPGDFVYLQSAAVLALGGVRVEQVVATLADQVPDHWRDTMARSRSGPLHVTLIGPTELGAALSVLQGFESPNDTATCGNELLNLGSKLVPDFQARGLFLAVKKVVNGLLSTVLFVVVEWPAGQQFRAALNLGPTDFHITVGFTIADVFGVPKGTSTLTDVQARVAKGRLIREQRAALAQLIRPHVRLANLIQEDPKSDTEPKAHICAMHDLTEASFLALLLEYVRRCGACESVAARSALQYLVRLGSVEAENMLQETTAEQVKWYPHVFKGNIQARMHSQDLLIWLPLQNGAVALCPFTKKTQCSRFAHSLWYAGVTHVALLAQTGKTAETLLHTCTLDQIPVVGPIVLPEFLTASDTTQMFAFLGDVQTQLEDGARFLFLGPPRALALVSLCLLQRLGQSLVESVDSLSSLPTFSAGQDCLSSTDVNWCEDFLIS